MAYTPPIGIPNPSSDFGWEIDRTTPAWPASWLTPTTTPTAGYYFVDRTNPSATDSGNTYGHPDVPRLTIPYMGGTTLAGGAFVYIHAGTYNVGNQAVSGVSLTGIASSGSPIWFTGNAAVRPILQIAVNVGELADTSFIIIENFEFTYDSSGVVNGSIDVRPTGDDTTVDHVLIRNCVMTGGSRAGDTNGISIGGGTTSDEQTSYVVVYNCTISDYGLGTDDTSEQACIYNDYNLDHCWNLDNTLSLAGADCIAGSHSANDTDRLAQWLFIGRNDIACGGENGIDLKSWRYVVISQNTVHGAALREQGWLIVIHSGSAPVPVRDCWIIFNTVYHGSGGIYGTSTSGTQDCGVLGNVIYDIDSSLAVQPDILNGTAIAMLAIQGTYYITDNTLYDYEDGVELSGVGIGDAINLHGNIFNSRSDVSGKDLKMSNGDEAFVTMDYDFWPASARIDWAGNVYTLAQLQSNTAMEDNGLSGDPLFASPPVDLTLQSGSPCRNASIEDTAAYDAFETLFGIDIRGYDRAGNARPPSGAWDMGAYQYEAPSAPTRPGNPSTSAMAAMC